MNERRPWIAPLYSSSWVRQAYVQTIYVLSQCHGGCCSACTVKMLCRWARTRHGAANGADSSGEDPRFGPGLPKTACTCHSAVLSSSAAMSVQQSATEHCRATGSCNRHLHSVAQSDAVAIRACCSAYEYVPLQRSRNATATPP
jgi:hypothetical protein